MTQAANRWIQIYARKPAAKARLICFHHTGGSAQFYRGWDKYLPANIELCAVQFPGRGARMDEEPITRLHEMVAQVHANLSPLMDKPCLFLGNSFGCIVAYVWIRHLRKIGGPLPRHFFVLACIAPHLEAPDLSFGGEKGGLSLDSIQKAYGGLPDILLKDAQFAEMMARIFLADLEMIRSSRYEPEAPLPVPISAYGGSEDVRVNEASLKEWAKHTTREFRSMTFPGAHFFLEKSIEPFMKEFNRELDAIVSGL